MSVSYNHLRPGFRSGNRKRPLCEVIHRRELRKSEADYVVKLRVIDREKDYYEEIIRLNDGTVIHHSVEWLSVHLGHGTDKLWKQSESGDV